MKFASVTLALVASILVAGCQGYSGSTATGARPMGAASTAPSASSHDPQSANSLPPGDSVNAPITSDLGRVGTTRY
ncbi:MAG: hypothetical protein M3N26_05695 [Pseudomonadota bacterium]|nr:hypothetical protein [Pseudomonadota bacterium]